MKTQQKIFMNRELSWLKFNERVLEEAENREVPLCERLTFASIYQSNLDEFFMVRVGSLIDQMLLDKNMKENKTKMTPQEQIDAIIPQVQKLNRRKDSVYEEMMDSLKEHNIHLVNFQKISKKESEYLRAYFQAEIAPLISPTIIGKRQPFPFLKNKEIYAVAVLETKNGKEKLGIIPCGNETFDRLINISGKDAYMLSEEMILHYVPRIFTGYHVKAKTLIRITRNADIDADSMYDEDLDYRDFMVELIKKRKKLAPVRMELSREMDGEIIDLLCEYLELERKYVFYTQTPLDLSFVFKIQANMNKAHRDRIAFMRICSGEFEAGMNVYHVQGGKEIRLSQPQQMMASERKMITKAYGGDIIGVFDPGIFSIGDTLTTSKEKFAYEGIPTFAPEHFARVRQVDTMKRKQFVKGINQIAQEGAIQIFQEYNTGMEEIIVGVVGVLQFDVLKYRLNNEYNVEIRLENLPYEYIRWIENEDVDMDHLSGTSDMKKIKDLKDRPLLLFAHEWSIRMTEERNKGLILSEFGRS